MIEMLRIQNYDKKQVIEQWSKDPCGFHRVKGPEGTREFYESIERSRYETYPWMKSVLEFDQFPGKGVLEIGFGMGADLIQFAKAGCIVSGIDLVPRHLYIAKGFFLAQGLRAKLILADAENIPFDTCSFDVVYTFGVIHHTPNTCKAIDEIYRVLKPGRKAIIGVYHKYSANHIFGHLLNYILHLKFLRGESYRRALSRIEHREHGNACPLVKLYSKKQLRHMLQKFSSVYIQSIHIDRSHFGIFQKLVSKRLANRVEGKLGWFLIAKCIK